MTYFCAKFKGFRSRLHSAWDTGYFRSFKFDFTWDPEGSWILKFTLCGIQGILDPEIPMLHGIQGILDPEILTLRGIQEILDSKILT